MLEKILEEIEEKQVMLQPFDGSDIPLNIINVDIVKDIIRKHMDDETQQERYFTDDEYRILLSALRREDEVCRKVDQDCGGDHKLIRIMTSIKRKIRRIQYEKTRKPYNMDDGWIPCEERLPDEKVNPVSQDFYEYQVTARFGEVTDVRHYKFGNGHWWNGLGIVDEYVIAWKDRPEPYRQGKGDVQNETV